MKSELSSYAYAVEKAKSMKRRAAALLPVLSLAVIISVFWWLKLTGITMAGDAFCGLAEHTHSDECYTAELSCTEEHEHTDACYNKTLSCETEEHIHVATCYSDITADVETAEIWKATLPELPDDLSETTKLIETARSQLGYEESELNFILDENGERKGYTRYGEWFGNPYGDWSNMFTAFCLRHAGLEDLPISSGAETMRLEWEKAEYYKDAEGYVPVPGDIVFYDSNGNGTAETTAIVTGIDLDNITVIAGDVDGKVAEISFVLGDGAVMGYGTTSPESNLVMMAVDGVADDGLTKIANTVTYSSNMFSNNPSFLLYTLGSDGNYYAIDGNANAVPVTVDSDGSVRASVSNTDILFWTFEYCGTYDNRNTYYIQNVATGVYLHPYADSDTNHGAILSGKWESALYTSGTAIKFRGARQNHYAYLQNNSSFTNVGNLDRASGFYFAKAPEQVTLWLDGTNGGIMSYRGSANTSYRVIDGGKVKLPTQWQSPTKYAYVLKGWVDIRTGEYYLPGAEITVTGNTVLYADWIASSYDIGVYNAYVAHTVSTNEFITTKMFDYNALINLHSTSVNVNANSSGHSETWSHVANGNVTYKGQQTLNFSFNDHDSSGTITNLNNLNAANQYTGGGVYTGIFNDRLKDVLFSTDNLFNPATGEGVIGKHYIGEGDHLFQFDSDPNSEYYGYYYYDSHRNAASYNQSDGRFYVYDYLERASDSANSDGGEKYSDFLPLNSPYANTNGQGLVTYNYNGDDGEYEGVPHYQYDSRYDGSGNSTDNMKVNFWSGMSVEVEFDLPDVPGTRDPNGNYGNKDLYGKDMHFKFRGDDDVWILVDDQVVLDLGGIHQAEGGDINFSTGVVTVNGQRVGTLSGLGEGKHILTIYYLERGSSMANCAMYFNLAPRFGLTIQKEDVLTMELLNGAEFSVFKDPECTQPATLWASKESYDNFEDPVNVFTVKDGVCDMWGFSPSKNYYIKETKAPDSDEYSIAHGVICFTLDKQGVASYSMTIIEETDENGNKIPISNGFTVHGFKVDDKAQQAFIEITNAKEWVKETTTVQARKIWADGADHSSDYVTVYLTVIDPDGTVRRIREVILGKENNWKYTWTNIPKYYADGETKVQYGVEEAYYLGYTSTVEKVDKSTDVEIVWADAYEFKNGETYILKTTNGCIAAASNSTATKLVFVDDETAKTSPLARWVATVNSNGTVQFTNEAGQKLVFNYNRNSSSNRYFYATSGTSSYHNMSFKQAGSQGMKIYYVYSQWWSSTEYYFGSGTNNSGHLLATTDAASLIFTPMTERFEEVLVEADSFVYEVTNTKLENENETSFTVYKEWDLGMATGISYEMSQVTVKLLADGVDTGRTITLSLKNGWKDTFKGLPYLDSDGNVIEYTVVETWATNDWLPIYGQIKTVNGQSEVPSYETTVTNSYRWGHGVILPSTGGLGSAPWILSGLGIMCGSLVLGYVTRRRKERRRM